MPVNLINEKTLNDYLADIVYHGQEMETFTKGEFNSVAYVTQNKDAIVRSMMMQWMKHRLRAHLSEETEANRDFLQPLRHDEENLPYWAERCLSEGKEIYRFNAEKIPHELRENIRTVADYLYSAADSYVTKTLAKTEETEQKPRLRMDYLKTSNEWDSFEKTLYMAKKWHELIAKEAAKKERNERMYKASLVGTKTVMKLADGMEIVQLTTPEALDYESEYMGHCVGKGGYDDGVEECQIKIYSLRDADGEPHATFEVKNENEVYQCKGKGNKAPVARYRSYLQEFVRKEEFDVKEDKANVGLVKLYNKDSNKEEYYDIYNLPKDFVVEGDLDLRNMGFTELPDLSYVTVKGNFYCSRNQLTSLMGAPKDVWGDFGCEYNQLTSLMGAPKEIKGKFDCSRNQLTSLDNAPQTVGKDFICNYNQIESLKYMPQEVGGDVYCNYNKLTSLDGALPEVVGSFYCSSNSLTSLKGAPRKVGKKFDCNANRLTSLEGAPQEVGGNFFCFANRLVSLKGAPLEINGEFRCSGNQLTSLEGAPRRISGDFYCNDNHLTSLHGAPEVMEGWYLFDDDICEKYNIETRSDDYEAVLTAIKKYHKQECENTKPSVMRNGISSDGR